MPLREVLALVRGLPDTAAHHRRKGEDWTVERELLATAIEVLDFWGRQHAALKGVKPSKLPKPVQILRPGQAEEMNRVETDPRAIAAFFAGRRTRGRRG